MDLTPAERANLLESQGARDTLEIDKSFDNNMVLRADLHDAVIATKDRMVRTRRWKLVEIPGKVGPIQRLYDMEADPRQSKDLAAGGAHPMVAPLQGLIDAYWRGEGAELRFTPEQEVPPIGP